MGAHSGKEISNDNLVLSLDSKNVKKGFKGKPTENYYRFDNPTYVNWNNQDVVVSNPKPHIVRTHSSSGGYYSAISWMGGYFGDDADTSKKISYTAYVRGQGTARLQMHQINASPNSATNTARSGSYVKLHKQKWQRIELLDSYLCTSRAGCNILVCQEAGDNSYVELKKPQVELNDYPTAFVDEERTNTQTILDMTGNCTVTAENMKYNSDGSIEFVAADDPRIRCSHNSEINITGHYSVAMWVYANTSQNNIYPRLFDKGSTLLHTAGTTPFTVALNTSISGSLRQVALGSVLTSEEWTYLAATYDGSKSKIYKNGKLIVTNNFDGTEAAVVNSSGDLFVGNSSAGNREFNGKIDLFKLYNNRALNAREIKNNYESTKHRFI